MSLGKAQALKQAGAESFRVSAQLPDGKDPAFAYDVEIFRPDRTGEMTVKTACDAHIQRALAPLAIRG